jgi:ParB family transcriptional regulator, chromosome partitioning protein
MRALMEGEIGAWPVSELGLRYRRYRLADEAGERDMVQSLRRHGQITPLVVCRREETLEVLDGFKRVVAAVELGLVKVRCQVLAADERQAKVALLTLHGAGKRLVELEEAWLVQALVRDDGLAQVEVAELLGRHKSWVCRRLALLEKLVEEVRQDLRLGLVSARTARELVSLPTGNQSRVLRLIQAEGLSSVEVRGVVELLQGACSRDQEEYVLAQPRQALAEANQLICPAWDPRLSVAGNRFSKQLARLLDQLARMESWLNQQSRAELRACDRLALQPGLERLVQGSRSVAELAGELLAEVKA